MVIDFLRAHRRVLWFSFWLSTFTVAALQLPLALHWLFAVDAEIKQVDPYSFEIRLRAPGEGPYYILSPRAPGVCALLDGDRTLVTNGDLASGVPDRYSLQGTFSLGRQAEARPLTLRCSGPEQIPWAGAERMPIVTRPAIGRILDSIQFIRTNLLGLGFSVILFIMAIFVQRTAEQRSAVHSAHLLFAATAFVYSLSISKLQNLFMSDAAGTAIQMFMRGFFSVSFFHLCSLYARGRRGLVLFNFVASVALGLIAYFSPLTAVAIYYPFVIVVFVGSAFFVVYEVLKYPNRSSTYYIQIIALVWLFIQIEVVILYLLDITSFFSGGFIAVAALLLLDAILKDRVALEAETKAQRAELSASIRLNSIAEQVAHDIRSPVAALNLLMKKLPQLASEERALLESVTNRIQDIANQLLRLRKGSVPGTEEAHFQRVDVLHAAREIVREKTAQYGSEAGLKLALEGPQSDSIAAFAVAFELRRVLSNLIDNGVQAMGYRGSVIVSVRDLTKGVEVRVVDTGPGFPAELLPRAGQKGVTGKVDGNGLGLYHARTTVESWGGSIAIESVAGCGASVVLTLPRDAVSTIVSE